MAKDKRNYNVFLNVHTVSGIVITVGLFVCFFAGAIALFYQNINNWESNTATTIHHSTSKFIDYEKALRTIEKEGYNMDGRTFDFSVEEEGGLAYLTVRSVAKNKPKTKDNKKRQKPQKAEDRQKRNVPTEPEKFSAEGTIALYLDLETYEKVIDKKPGARSMEEHHGNPEALGTSIYHLHYFDQLPVIGVYLSGFVSLFFLIAIITGFIIHWKKVVQNFFTFRLKHSLKNLWTDAHTALGVIGLPFQLMFAVTGTLMGLLMIYVLATTTIVLDGDRAEFMRMIVPNTQDFPASGVRLIERVNINDLATQSVSDLHIDDVFEANARIVNYNDSDALFLLDYENIAGKAFYQRANIMYQLRDGKVVSKNAIDEQRYRLGLVISTIQTLHFGNYGGNLLKIIYFVLSLMTCFVILSGVLIWLEARNNKRYKEKRTFNNNVGHIFFGICMGLYPAIAFFFCLTKILPNTIENRFYVMEHSFFLFWLGFIFYAYWIKDIHVITKHALLLASVLGILIPVLNGLHSGLWFWNSLASHHTDSFFVDVTWLISGIITLIIALKMKPTLNKKKAKLKQQNSELVIT